MKFNLKSADPKKYQATCIKDPSSPGSCTVASTPAANMKLLLFVAASTFISALLASPVRSESKSGVHPLSFRRMNGLQYESLNTYRASLKGLPYIAKELTLNLP